MDRASIVNNKEAMARLCVKGKVSRKSFPKNFDYLYKDYFWRMGGWASIVNNKEAKGLRGVSSIPPSSSFLFLTFLPSPWRKAIFGGWGMEGGREWGAINFSSSLKVRET
jgi:hypothetical protein